MQKSITKISLRKLERKIELEQKLKRAGTSSSKNVGAERSHQKKRGLFARYGYGKRASCWPNAPPLKRCHFDSYRGVFRDGVLEIWIRSRKYEINMRM